MTQPIYLRRGTAAAWTTANPVLSAGEPGFETDTLKFKLGDGVTAWVSLAYQGVDAALTKAGIIATGLAATDIGGTTQALSDARYPQSGAYAPLDATGHTASLARSWSAPLNVIGHSYTLNPGFRCTAGLEFFNQIKNRGVCLSATTYGLGGARLIEVANQVVNGAFNNMPAGGLWPNGTRPGVVALDCLFNDYVNTSGLGDNTTPSALTATQILGIQHALRTILAVVSARTRVEEPASAAGWSAFPQSALVNVLNVSGASCLYTATQGAAATYSVTIPAGVNTLWAITTIGDATAGPKGDVVYKIAGTTVGSLTQTSSPQFATINSGQASSSYAAYNACPAVAALNVTAYSGTTVTVTVTKADATANNTFIDAILVPFLAPPPVAVIIDPACTSAGSAPYYTAPKAAIIAANKALLVPAVQSVVAQFPNAFTVDAGLLAANGDLSYIDGVHAADRGMRKIADVVLAGVNAWLATHDPDSVYAAL